MKTYKEALEKIVNYKHDPKGIFIDDLIDTIYSVQSIAAEALQSESEVKEDCEKHRFICLDYPDDGWKQCMYCKVLKKIDYPKSEERTYSEEEVWLKAWNSCVYAVKMCTYTKHIEGLYGSKFTDWDKVEEFKQRFIQSRQPKTEESPIVIEESPLESEWRKLKEQPYMPIEKEQPTSPSKSDDIEQIIIDQINQSFNEYQGTNEAIQDAAYFLARRFQGYKDRLEELEKWAKEFFVLKAKYSSTDYILTSTLLDKIQELKNK